MLGLVLIYWIGKKFYQLAEKFDHNKWAFAILGVVSYYGGIMISGFVGGILLEIFSPGYVETSDEFLLGLLFIPFGILSCYALYKILESQWKNKKEKEEMLKETIDF